MQVALFPTCFCDTFQNFEGELQILCNSLKLLAKASVDFCWSAASKIIIKIYSTGFSKLVHLPILLLCWWGQSLVRPCQIASKRLLQVWSFANSTLLSWTKYCSALSNYIQPTSPDMFNCQFLWIQQCLASITLIKMLF